MSDAPLTKEHRFDDDLANENHCKSPRESLSCENMKEVENDTGIDYQHYECKVCGRTMSLHYEEIR